MTGLKTGGFTNPPHPHFAKAFNCLCDTDWSSIPDGRFEIDGDDVFAIVDRRTGKGMNEATLEIHRRYIDIQFLVSGEDVMGFTPLSDCLLGQPFDQDRDVGFFEDRPASWFEVKENCFAIFYPTDAHAPMGTESDFHKVVVKVAV